ncbi:CYFA0S12e00947g1_1 [Cyberlindnera fabianii]|uniref:CYFA0S12e00947g1_1 n=1 Tax=Cyberlindnera fabianii TaxID=36022 RepID=A0A061B6J1_CYBFA|nr:CYFA0S12e00947g1_1 [Cyberlindnera fabianii]
MPSELKNLFLIPELVCFGIVPYLDNYSLMSLLEAFPYLQKFVSIIRDYHSKENRPRFFTRGIEGAQQIEYYVSRHESITQRSNYLKQKCIGAQVTPLIKLLEITSGRTMQDIARHGMISGEMSGKMVSLNLNRRTFAYVQWRFDQMHGQGRRSVEFKKFQNRLEEASAKWYVGRAGIAGASECVKKNPPEAVTNNPNRFKLEMRLKVNPFYYQRRDTFCFKFVRSLKIENVAVIKDFAAPALEELVVIYSKQDRIQMRFGPVQAPRLRSFVIHYNGVAPVIDQTSVNFADRPVIKNASSDNALLPYFELADSTMIQRNHDPLAEKTHLENYNENIKRILTVGWMERNNVARPPNEDLSQGAFKDMSFLDNIKMCNFIGVDDIVITAVLRHRLVNRMNWHMGWSSRNVKPVPTSNLTHETCELFRRLHKSRFYSSLLSASIFTGSTSAGNKNQSLFGRFHKSESTYLEERLIMNWGDGEPGDEERYAPAFIFCFVQDDLQYISTHCSVTNVK